MTDWQKFLESNQERFERELLDFVSIPSVSASSEYVDDVERAARWVSNRLEKGWSRKHCYNANRRPSSCLWRLAARWEIKTHYFNIWPF